MKIVLRIILSVFGRQEKLVCPSLQLGEGGKVMEVITVCVFVAQRGDAGGGKSVHGMAGEFALKRRGIPDEVKIYKPDR